MFLQIVNYNSSINLEYYGKILGKKGGNDESKSIIYLDLAPGRHVFAYCTDIQC